MRAMQKCGRRQCTPRNLLADLAAHTPVGLLLAFLSLPGGDLRAAPAGAAGTAPPQPQTLAVKARRQADEIRCAFTGANSR